MRDGDAISRQAAIDALWKALYEYEDRTEKQFQDSDELDVEDWIQHRIFVQNMSDIDRQTIMDLPSAQPEPCDYVNACIEVSMNKLLSAYDYLRVLKEFEKYGYVLVENGRMRPDGEI